MFSSHALTESLHVHYSISVVLAWQVEKDLLELFILIFIPGRTSLTSLMSNNE